MELPFSGVKKSKGIVAFSGKRKIAFGLVKFEILFRHPSADVEQVIGYLTTSHLHCNPFGLRLCFLSSELLW